MTSFNFLSIALDARRITRGAPELLAARQHERLNELVTFARAHSRFYAEKYRGLPETIRDVRQLPPVTKPELMAHFDEVITDLAVRKADVQKHIADLGNLGKRFLGKYMVWTTSGTTGTPGIFLENKNWEAVISAVNVLRIGGEWYNRDVIKGMMKAGGNSASVFAGNGHFFGVTMLERQRQSNRSRGKRIQLIPVTLPINEIVQRLNALQPAMFAGYASALGLLAQEQLEGRLNIHPSIVISSAEPLSAENRALIQQAFGVPPRNNYGCSEGGVMGYECKQCHMHLNADWVLFESVDAAHQPIPAGRLSAAPKNSTFSRLLNLLQSDSSLTRWSFCFPSITTSITSSGDDASPPPPVSYGQITERKRCLTNHLQTLPATKSALRDTWTPNGPRGSTA